MSAALAIRDVLVADLPGLLRTHVRGSAKVIALKVGTTPRCIEGLRQGEHVARSDVLLALGKHYPAVRQKINELMDAEQGSGDDPARVLDEIAKLVRGRL